VRLVLLLILIGVPIAELFVLIKVGGRIGTLYTIGLVILTAAVGLMLVRLQGMNALARAQAHIEENRLPVGEAVDGVFLVIAGGLLLLPGFITDAIGLLLLVPIIRRGIGVAIWTAFGAHAVVGARQGGPRGRPGHGDNSVIDGEFEDVTGNPDKDRDGGEPRLPPAGDRKPPKDERK